MKPLLLLLLIFPSVTLAHNIVCSHTHVHAFRVECLEEFERCKENSKDGCCITKKTVGLIPTWDCACVTSDKKDLDEPILIKFDGFEMELRAKPTVP